MSNETESFACHDSALDKHPMGRSPDQLPGSDKKLVHDRCHAIKLDQETDSLPN